MLSSLGHVENCKLKSLKLELRNVYFERYARARARAHTHTHTHTHTGSHIIINDR